MATRDAGEADEYDSRSRRPLRRSRIRHDASWFPDARSTLGQRSAFIVFVPTHHPYLVRGTLAGIGPCRTCAQR
jgi:hypothetical protein